MRTSIALFVAGTPKPQPRPRFVGGRAVSTLDAKTNAWKGQIRASVTQARSRSESAFARFGFGTPIELNLVFSFESERHTGLHTHKPDADNLAKLVMDALVDAKAWEGDDSRVAVLYCRKQWCAPGEGGVAIEITTTVADEEKPEWL